jgi:hypothetical protein
MTYIYYNIHYYNIHLYYKSILTLARLGRLCSHKSLNHNQIFEFLRKSSKIPQISIKLFKTLFLSTKNWKHLIKKNSFLLPSAARQHPILDTPLFLQSWLDPVFRAIYVLSRSRFVSVRLLRWFPGGIIKLQEVFFNEGGGQTLFCIVHLCKQF